jgi:hypothetical protein
VTAQQLADMLHARSTGPGGFQQRCADENAQVNGVRYKPQQISGL